MGVGAGHDHLAGLQRLTQAVERLRRELGQFIQEEHAVVRQRGFAGAGLEAAAGERGHAGGVVRRAERPGAGQGALGDQSGDGVDHRSLEQLAGRERRQQARQPARQHRLARARRSDEQQVVAAGRGDLERAFGALLTLDVAQVRPRLGVQHRPRLGRAQHLDAAEVVDQGDQRARRQHRRLPAPGRLRAIGLGADQAEPEPVRGHRRGQHAADRGDPAIQRQLADGGPAGERVRRDHAHGRQDAQRNRQVVVAAFLGQVRRRQVDDDAPRRHRQPEAREGRADALAALAHRLVAEADDDRPGLAAGELDLDVDPPRVDALKGHGHDTCEHRLPSPINTAESLRARKNKSGTVKTRWPPIDS